MTSTTLRLCGPNLPGGCDDFELHAAGCAHLRRGYLRGADGYDFTTDGTPAELTAALVADLNSDFAGDEGVHVAAYLVAGNGYTPGSGIHVAPCAAPLIDWPAALELLAVELAAHRLAVADVLEHQALELEAPTLDVPRWHHPAYVVQTGPSRWLTYDPTEQPRWQWSTAGTIGRASRWTSYDAARLALDTWAPEGVDEGEPEPAVIEYEPAHRTPDGRPVQWVTLWRISTAYGGPEEGGWYFDVGDPVAVIACPTEAGAREIAGADPLELAAAIGYPTSTRDTYSVTVSTELPQPYPTDAPRYE